MMPFYAAGLVYAFVFWAVCSKRPQIALMLIFASAPFQNDISGGGPLKFSLAEVNLLLSIPLLFVNRRPIVMRPLIWPIAFYYATGVLASVITWRDSSLISLIQISLYWIFAPLVFIGLARTPKDYQLGFNCLVIVGVFLAIAGIVSGSNYYLGLTKNGVGGSLGCAVVVGTEMFLSASRKRQKWYAMAVGIMVCGLIMTLSRGAWLATLTGFVILFGLRRQFGVMMRVGLIVVPLVLVSWQFLPKQSKSYAFGISKDNYSIAARYKNAAEFRSYFVKSPLLGVGIGLRKEVDATSIIWLTLAETGVIGLIAFLSVHLVFFSMIWRDQGALRRSSVPYTLLAIGGALVAGRFAHGLFDHYWGRGPMMIAWASAGMAVRAHMVANGYRRLARQRRLQRIEGEIESRVFPGPVTRLA